MSVPRGFLHPLPQHAFLSSSVSFSSLLLFRSFLFFFSSSSLSLHSLLLLLYTFLFIPSSICVFSRVFSSISSKERRRMSSEMKRD
jgi:hypothetical protein